MKTKSNRLGKLRKMLDFLGGSSGKCDQAQAKNYLKCQDLERTLTHKSVS